MIKVNEIVGKICGGRSKYCWLKLAGLAGSIFFFAGITYFMLFNFSYNKEDGAVIKASEPGKLKRALKK